MFNFLLNLLFLAALGVIWIAILWFGIQPDHGKWSDVGLVSMHILPPVAIWLSWWMGSKLVKRSKARQIEKSEKKAQAERLAAVAAAREKHVQGILQRRFACDCRLVVISDLAIHEELELPEDLNVSVSTAEVEEKANDIAHQSILDALEPAIAQALRDVYTKCGAAAAFPLYIVPPANASGVEVVQRLHAIHAQLIEDLALPIKSKAEVPSILYLPSSDSASNSVIGLFEKTPDLPGAVVLAFDSPLAHAHLKSLIDDDETEQDHQTGKHGHGVFALLVTHPDLPTMLASIPDGEEHYENKSIIPFWDRAPPPQGNLALLALASKQLRDQLAVLVPVARIRRAASGASNEKPGHVLELERTLTTLLEQAQINAGLMDLPFPGDDAANQPADKNTKQDEAASRCEWLVHNGGDLARGGLRMASISNALMAFQIELPNDMKTSIVRQVGDLGQATPIGMLALALAQAQKKGAPTLCAEFSGRDNVAVAFAVPVQAQAA